MRIGELFIFGLEMNNYKFLKETASNNGLGGIVIFPRNLDSVDELHGQIDELEELSKTKLIIGVDQEGGQVSRLESLVPSFPSMQHYGCSRDIEGLKQFVSTTAKHLHKLGINTNFAPVCDVLTNPDNELMRSRCFGSDSELVTEMVKKVIEEFDSKDILTCAKHFPGLGSASIDPHKHTAATDINLHDFANIHWPPFKVAIESGVPIVMTTHLIANELDEDNMATFSKPIVEKYLRDRMRYSGVVITDDLGMGGVAAEYSPEQRAVNAFLAGHDLLMFCHNPEDQKSAFKAMLNSLDRGDISEDRIESSLDRIADLKRRLE